MPGFSFNHRVASRSRKPVQNESNSNPNGLGEGISISGMDKVWRRGTSNNFSLTVPVNYSYTLDIIEHESMITGFATNSMDIVKTQSGTYSGSPVTVTHTFTALGAYDIRVRISKGSLSFERWWVLDQGIIASFEKFVEGGAGVTTYDLATQIGYKSFSGDNTGKKILLKNSGTSAGYLAFEGLSSTDPQNPAMILCETTGGPIRITGTTAYCMRFNRGNRNVWFDGAGNPDYLYGMELYFSGASGHAQTCFIEAGDSGTVAATVSKNLWIIGVKTMGISGTASDSSSHFKIDTPFNINLNYDTWLANGQGAFEDCHIMHCEINSGDDEGCYLGPVDTTPHPTYISVPLVRLRVAGIVINDTGGDGFQIGAGTIDSEAVGITCTNVATRNDPSHKNIFQFSSSNQNLAFYRNKGVSGKNMFTVATGNIGKELYVFSNELNCPTSDSNGHTNVFIRVDENSYGDNTNLPVNFIHNTQVAQENKIYELWNANSVGITTIMDLKILNNMIIGDGSALTTKFNNIVDTTWVVTNNTYGTNGSTAGFTNWGTKDYRPAALTGSMYGTVSSFTLGHPMMAYDEDGYKWVAAYPVRGSKQNVPLMT